MSWFKKKKSTESDKKKSSDLTIETMHADLEDNEGDANTEKKNLKETKGEIEKKSPFLTENKFQEKEAPIKTELAPEKNVAVEDKLPSEPASVKDAELDTDKSPEKENSIATDKKNLDIAQVPTKEIPEEEQKGKLFRALINKEAPTKGQDSLEEKKQEESEEDKMEKIVKEGPIIAPGPLLKKTASKIKTPEDVELSENKVEDKIYIDKTRQKTKTSVPTTASPFGVPKKGVPVAEMKKDVNEEKTKNLKKINKPLLFLAIFILILTIAAFGINYYRNSQKEVDSGLPSLLTETNLAEPDYKKDNFADTGIVLKTSPELLLADLKAFIKKEKAINPDRFVSGQLIRPLQKETRYLTGVEILKIFGSEDPVINTFLGKPAMLFVTEEEVRAEEPVTVSAPTEITEPVITTKKVIKVALVLELKTDTNPGDVIERLTEIETTFPGTLKNLMIEEDIVLINEKISFHQASPERKDLVHAIRYYNFKYGNVTRSIEWGSLLYKNKSYVFFSTSKDATSSLIKALY